MGLFTRLIVLAPWFGIGWLIILTLRGYGNAFLMVLLILLLIPLAAIANLISIILIKTLQAIALMKLHQRAAAAGQDGGAATTAPRKKLVNYADLAWYDVRRWMQR